MKICKNNHAASVISIYLNEKNVCEKKQGREIRLERVMTIGWQRGTRIIGALRYRDTFCSNFELINKLDGVLDFYNVQLDDEINL